MFFLPTYFITILTSILFNEDVGSGREGRWVCGDKVSGRGGCVFLVIRYSKTNYVYVHYQQLYHIISYIILDGLIVSEPTSSM